MATMKYDGGSARDAATAAPPKKAEAKPTPKQIANKARVVDARQKGNLPTNPPKASDAKPKAAPKPAPKTGTKSVAKTATNMATKARKKQQNPKSYPAGSDTRWALEMKRKGFSGAETERRGKKRFGPDYGPE